MTARNSGLPPSLESLFAQSPETVVLGNGLKVVFQQQAAHPVVSVQVWINSGSIHEGNHLGSGLSHFLEHMLFKGTHKRGPGQLASEVQALGGNINAYTAFDRTVYYIDGPSEALGQILELLSDQVLNASLPEEEVARERDVILREIDMTLDDPDRILGRSLFTTAYNQHPFKYPVIGLRPLFEQVDRAILEAYYKSRYQPENMVVTVAGCFERETLLKELEATFAQFPRGCLSPVNVPREEAQLAFRESRLYGDYRIGRGLMGFKVPSMRDVDSPGLDILAAIIGSGHSGRLRQKLREELHLVHGISASTWNPANPGLFFIQYSCDGDKAEAAEAAILETCRELASTGFTQAELDKARNFAFVSEIHSRQTSSGMASRLGLVAALVGDLHYPRRYFEKIHGLTTEDLRQLANETFQQNNLSVATLLPDTVDNSRSGDSAKKVLPAFAEKTLSNGARIYWQKDANLPRAWIRFAGLGGPSHEPESIRGATSLLATVLNRDTEFKTAFEIADELETEGCFLSDTSGNNTFALAVEVTPQSINKGIDALRNALLHPAFNDETVKRERDAQVAHLKSLEDEILDYGKLILRQRFFGEHPFADHPCGQIETAESIDASDLRQLKDKLLVGPNAVIVVTGDFDPDVIIPELEQLLLQLPDSLPEGDSPSFAGPATLGEIHETMDREQSVVFEAYPDVGVKPETSLVGDLLNELLSDMSGPLFTAVREERSLAYYVGASRLLGLEHGCFYLYAGTHPSTAADVFECFDSELGRIRGGQIPEEELEAAKTRMKVSKRFALQSPRTRASIVALNALFRKPVMDWLDYEERLDAIGVEDVAAFARDVLATEKRLRLTVSPN
ncbi:MAG: M16 family metallopeptidase [Puniceicoccaceae bacterium]